jgi:hypothetical protein
MEIALLIWSLALTILVGVGVVWVLDLQGRLLELQDRYEDIFSGEIDDEANVAVALEKLATRLSKTNARTERLVARAEQISDVLSHTVQGVGLIRFRAYEDTGGDQSFALALVDGEGNGVVVSALYGRDATRVYAKPIEGWLSSRTLTEEDRQALAKARKSVMAQ